MFFLGFGFAVEKGFRRFAIARHYQLENNDISRKVPSNDKMGNMDKFNATMMKAVPDVVGLFVFFGASYLSYFSFIWIASPFLQLFFLAFLLSISLIRLISITSQIIFSPSVLQFRILPLNCKTANIFNKLIVWTGGYIIVAMMFSIVTHRLGGELNTVIILRAFFATLLLIATAAAVVVFREKIQVHILKEHDPDKEPTWGRKMFASIWHILALLYLFILLLLLINTIDTTQQVGSSGAFTLSFFVVPIWMIADRLTQWMVKYSLSTLKIYKQDTSSEDMSEEELVQQEKGRVLYGKCRTTARTGLIVAIGIWLASLWGITVPFLSNLASVFFDASIILALALVFWKFVSSWIERVIQESMPDTKQDTTEDDEWGGAASRGRSYTLLPMIRKFIGSILVVMVTMTILSSMGVDIGPLLAGAGVVGLAIGFGAQKLVADMFSGFFYLLDDAFRVGEYLEAGNVSGTVENITLRNVLLRHHRGMLQIVPHSDLGAITNFMRGGIVVKFNLDFPYDSDIDQIRKVIKKVGQAMLEDEEYGKDFIRPVKSQGVREISNSVMTIRVKFTANPGSHFVIRREAYKKITEALKAKGINYAHRKVIVDLPQATDKNLTDDQLKAAGAAALQTTDEISEEKTLLQNRGFEEKS